jgi:hypothetical protein
MGLAIIANSELKKTWKKRKVRSMEKRIIKEVPSFQLSSPPLQAKTGKTSTFHSERKQCSGGWRLKPMEPNKKISLVELQPFNILFHDEKWGLTWAIPVTVIFTPCHGNGSLY